MKDDRWNALFVSIIALSLFAMGANAVYYYSNFSMVISFCLAAGLIIAMPWMVVLNQHKDVKKK